MKLRQFIPVLIVAAGVWAYHNSFQGPFIYDDVGNILKNRTIRHLWPMWDVLSPPPALFVGGRPVLNLSLALNCAMGGLAVWGYHALNLAVHLLAALVLFGILRRTLEREKLRDRFGAAAVWLAAAIALIWEVHPLQTEAVTYISQRCESLMGLFYLLCLYGFIRGTESRRSLGWFSLSVAACFLGVGCKEVMVTAPLMVLLYDRTFVSGNFREAWTRHRRLYLGLAGSWLWLGDLMVGLHNRDVGYGLGITWWGYALTECRAVVRYLRLAVWPHPLIFDYGQYVPTEPLATVVPYALILAVLATGILFALKRRPAIGFVGAWFFVILAPTSSVVPIVGSPMAEHRMYLPLAAVVTMVVVGVVALGKRLLKKQQGVVLGCIAGGSVVVLLTFLTIQRNRDYNSEMTIWQDTVEKRLNNPRAHNNLGFILSEEGRIPEAIGQYEEALRIQPDYTGAHYDLGNALVQLGRVAEAIGHYEQALRLKPDYTGAHYNLGLALARLGRLPEAIAHYQQALRIQPDYTDTGSYAEIHNDLGLALVQLGRVPEAIEHYEEALRIQPDYAAAHYNLGLALLQQGRLPEAISHWEQAVRINPDYADAHYNLGLALWQTGQLPEAVGHYEQALRINPDSVEAHVNLGIALSQMGKRQEGLAQFREALRRRPDSAEVHYNVGRALFQTGNVPEAIEQYEQVLQTNPDSVQAHCDLGLALAKLGRTPEAIQQYEQALRIKPDFVRAQNALARARAVQ